MLVLNSIPPVVETIVRLYLFGIKFNNHFVCTSFLLTCYILSFFFLVNSIPYYSSLLLYNTRFGVYTLYSFKCRIFDIYSALFFSLVEINIRVSSVYSIVVYLIYNDLLLFCYLPIDCTQ